MYGAKHILCHYILKIRTGSASYQMTVFLAKKR